MRALLVFVDGIGVGPGGAHNPFDGAPLRVLAPLAGEPGDPRVSFTTLDATLGYPGLPQSATGQAALFTGADAVAIAGGHREGCPTRPVAELVLRQSALGRARAAGRRAALLNAYDPVRAERLTAMARGQAPVHRHLRPSASSLAELSGGGRLRTLDDARAGQAVTFDFTGEVLRAFGVEAPVRTLGGAAQVLAAAASGLDLALFETFLTDKAGHAQDMTWARHEIARLERFLSALLEATDPREQLVVVTSDHGNLEDLSTRSHTRAPVPLLAWGPGARALSGAARSLVDVAPWLLSALGA